VAFAKKDRIFFVVICVLLVVLFVSSGTKKVKNVPDDERHKPFYAVVPTGEERTETEKRCTICHGAGSAPLSKVHPPKEQCLLCHKLVRR